MANLLERLLEAYANSCSSSVFDEIRDECTKKINLIGSVERRRPKLQLCDFSRMQFPARPLPVNIKGQDSCFLYGKAFV